MIDGIKSQGEYTLREEPTRDVPLRGRWTCSHPAPACSWTIDAAAEPYARERDFGNWRPAHVTLIKQLDPADDPGRFDLSVGDRVLAGAGDRDRRTFRMRPGTYPVAETPGRRDRRGGVRLVRDVRRAVPSGRSARPRR